LLSRPQDADRFRHMDKDVIGMLIEHWTPFVQSWLINRIKLFLHLLKLFTKFRNGSNGGDKISHSPLGALQLDLPRKALQGPPIGHSVAAGSESGHQGGHAEAISPLARLPLHGGLFEPQLQKSGKIVQR